MLVVKNAGAEGELSSPVSSASDTRFGVVVILDTWSDADCYYALHNIAGIVNEKGNVLGMIPHPECACEGFIGGCDGNLIFEYIA